MDEVLTPKEVAERLKVSQVWIYKLVREKRIPFYRLGKNVRFSEIDLQKWMEESRNKEYHRDQN